MSENNEINRTGDEIAIIGMAGRFPGARDIEEFWNNLKNGIESIAFITDEELNESGIDPELLKNPNYVRTRGGVLEDKDCFDAHFFDYTVIDARLMDPQIRIFHECTWEALENAGYDPYAYDGLIGLYAGASSSSYWEALVHFSGMSTELGEFAVSQLARRDFLCTRLAHKLDLKGPAINIQTACSTSLVAVHMACQAILDGECSMALAGGVSVRVEKSEGYLFQEGMIYSPDGHCRAFDAQAKGCVGGNGVGIVVLKALESALADGDYIYAVIRGSAINNDGLNKAGYAAPSVKGQADVIQAALKLAAVNPESITYVETHGTGTELGDPIEIEALKQAYNTDKKKYCAIGSVKTNIGHLDAAAGIAGLIKTVLALQNKLIPPSLHYKKANPKIDFENSPFYVNAALREWNNGNGLRLAGVSSFGIGGTNAHLIVEEAPAIPNVEEKNKLKLFLLSARTQTALEKLTQNLADFLKTNPGVNLDDTAYTLQMGRNSFEYKQMLVCDRLENVVKMLYSPNSESVKTNLSKNKNPPLIFMFPGQGSQYLYMGLELYEKEPVFRQEMDRCFAILESIMGQDLKKILYPGNHVHDDLSEGIIRTEIAQPLIFAVEYSLSKMLMKWGITPYAMIGHSIGEYTSACLAGVFSLEDALMLVNERGRLMQQMPGGAMLSVPLECKQLEPLLNSELSLAAVNNPTHCVVSGSHERIDAFEKQLKEKGFDCRRLHTSHAFHSKAMDPILKKFEEKVREIKLNIPQISYISNVTGNWISVRDVKNPAYWSTQLRQTVNFSDGVDKLLENKDIIFVEVGPGKTLSTFVRQHKIDFTSQKVINLMRHPNEDEPDDRYLLNKIGELWLFGVNVDWKNFYEGKKRHRIPLPSYPFERKRFPIGNDFENNIFSKENVLRKNPDKERWFYIPIWEQSASPVYTTDEKKEQLNWLLFMDEKGVGSRIAECLKKNSQYVVTVKSGQEFSAVDDYQFVINPRYNNDYGLLFEELKKIEMVPDRIIHLWNLLIPSDMNSVFGDLDKHLDFGFYSLLYTVQAIGKYGITSDIKLQAITCGMQNVTGEEELNPLQALVRGAIKVIPLEYSTIRCCNVDILLPGPGNPQEDKLVERLLGEFDRDFPDIIAAYRGTHRWIQKMAPHRLDKPDTLIQRLEEKGVYLITGGFGGMGFSIAEHLAKNFKARLILVGRMEFPERENWQNWLGSHAQNDKVSIKIRKILEVEEMGSRIMTFSADVSNEERMREVISTAEEKFGPIDGIIHTAGIADIEGVIQRRTRSKNESVMAPKVKGVIVLDRIFKYKKPRFFALFSSLGNMIYKIKFGQVGYNAANEFLDAFAHFKSKGHFNCRQEETYTFTINWEDWKEVGMSVEALKRRAEKQKRNADYEVELAGALLPCEGVEVFNRILGSGLTQVVVSTRDLVSGIKFINNIGVDELLKAEVEEKITLQLAERPYLSTKYVAPVTETEKILADTWEKFFEIQQVGILDDFFELGGDSLKAITILGKIHKKLDVKIPLTELFKNPTIEKIAKFITKSDENRYIPMQPAERKEYYILSAAQKRIYFIQQLDRQSTAYNLTYLFELEGRIEKKTLEDAFQKLIERHDSFRTSFEMIKNEPVQKIHEYVEFKVEFCEKKYGVKYDKIIKEFIRPFDLSHAPLIHVRLMKTSEEKYLLMTDKHHIITDGISYSLFVKDLLMLYSGKELPKLKLQYKDYSEWQNRNIQSKEMKSQEAYWLTQFKEKIPVLNLPIDFTRPEMQVFDGSFVPVAGIGNDEISRIKEVLKKKGTTMHVFLLSVFYIFLFKYTNQEDIIVGITATNRFHNDLENIIGMFVNMLAIRNFPSHKKKFIDFLDEVNKCSMKAYENQDFQFDTLIEKLKLKRDISRNPLFDVVFLFQSIEEIFTQTRQMDSENIRIHTILYEYDISRYDLLLNASETKNGLNFRFNYRKTLFKKSTIEAMGRHLKNIISEVIKNPSIRLSDIKMVSDAEELCILKGLNPKKNTAYVKNKGIYPDSGKYKKEINFDF